MTSAVFWIATQSHINEAIQSARSVARAMPFVDRLILTSYAYDHPDSFTGHYLSPGRQHHLWYLDFVATMNWAINKLVDYDKLLYLDTDTYMAHSVNEIFELLDYYDIASTHAPARQISYTIGHIPACFSEYNTGVLAFRNNEQVRGLFAEWLKLYRENPELYGENDQAPLRECLLAWPGRAYVMPLEYNCRFGFGGQAAGLIKILHGRSGDMAGLAQKINDNTGIRGWRRGDFS